MLARLLAQVHALVFPLRADERVVQETAPDTLLALLDPELVPLGDGYYRVGYPAEWRDRLLDADILESTERVAVIDDNGRMAGVVDIRQIVKAIAPPEATPVGESASRDEHVIHDDTLTQTVQ